MRRNISLGGNILPDLTFRHSYHVLPRSPRAAAAGRAPSCRRRATWRCGRTTPAGPTRTSARRARRPSARRARARGRAWLGLGLGSGVGLGLGLGGGGRGGGRRGPRPPCRGRCLGRSGGGRRRCRQLRRHPPPDKKKLGDLASFAAKHGLNGDTRNSKALHESLQRARRHCVANSGLACLPAQQVQSWWLRSSFDLAPTQLMHVRDSQRPLSGG